MSGGRNTGVKEPDFYLSVLMATVGAFMSDKVGQGPKYMLVDLEHHTFYRQFSGRIG
jgi:hypothetical protein